MTSSRLVLEAAAFRAVLALPERVQRALVGKPVVVDGQRLSTETQLMLALQRLSGEEGLATQPIGESRASVLRQARIAGGRQRIGAVRDLVVDGAEGPIGARLYVPSASAGSGRVRPDPAPTLMFIHGGGMATGDLDSHDGACRFLAEHSGVQVLAVDYALAPEHPFPAAPDDCFAAYQWLVKNTDSVGADPERLAVGGDSAGGYLAAATAIQAAEAGLPLALQLLIYPATDFVRESRTRRLFGGGGFYLTSEGMDRCTDWYFPNAADRSHPLGSVLLREDFPPGLAPAHVVTAGFDPLRDEGEAYADLLARHGVPVTRKRYPSMIHGFFNVVGAGREARACNRDIAAELARLLN